MNDWFVAVRILLAVAALTAYAVHQVASHNKKARHARVADIVIAALVGFQLGATLAVIQGSAS